MSINTYTNTLKNAGNSPFEQEEDRLPYPVFEALSQNEEYVKLAQLRYLVSEGEMDFDGEAGARLLAAHDAVDDAVLSFVSDWLVDNADRLIDEGNVDAVTVGKACEEYGVGGQ